MDRRRFLLTAGASATVGLAGCGGSSSDGTSLDEHDAAADLEAQPHLGPIDENVVLAFEDPACPNCGRFHEQTLPQIRANLVDPGEGGFVLRTFPVLGYAWNEPAAKALEGAFDRNEDAFWDLQSFVYDEQSTFDESNVLEKTATFLTEQTEVDGESVVEAVEAGDYDDAVQADLDAAEEGEIGEGTPTVLVFRDGVHQTTATGPVDYDVIAGALGL